MKRKFSRSLLTSFAFAAMILFIQKLFFQELLIKFLFYILNQIVKSARILIFWKWKWKIKEIVKSQGLILAFITNNFAQKLSSKEISHNTIIDAIIVIPPLIALYFNIFYLQFMPMNIFLHHQSVLCKVTMISWI